MARKMLTDERDEIILPDAENRVTINTAQMPKVEVKILCSTFLDAVQKFYENPQNRAKFEAWKAGRKKEHIDELRGAIRA